jgi:hypothetical protein
MSIVMANKDFTSSNSRPFTVRSHSFISRLAIFAIDVIMRRDEFLDL